MLCYAAMPRTITREQASLGSTRPRRESEEQSLRVLHPAVDVLWV